MIELAARPRLARKARLRFDAHSGRQMLLYPERGLALNATRRRGSSRCATGERTVAEIVERARRATSRRAARAHRGRGPGVPARARRPRPARGADAVTPRPPSAAPVHAGRRADLPLPARAAPTARTRSSSRATPRAGHRRPGARVLRRGRGAGGRAAEPDRRRAAGARRSRGAGRGGARAASSTPTSSPAASPLDRASGWRRWRRRGSTPCSCRCRTSTPHGAACDRRARRSGAPSCDGRGWARALGLPLTLNVVLHRGNIARVRRVRRARRASWAPIGSSWPTRSTSAGRSPTARRCCRRAPRSTEARADGARGARAPARQDGDPVRAARLPRRSAARLHGRLGAPLHRRGARRHRAAVPPGPRDHRASRFENVRERPLAEIWRDVAGFRAFRGEAWMPEPCRELRRRTVDFGGCRCQAFALTGDAGATDPACALSPRHDLVARRRAPGLTRHIASASDAPVPIRLRRFRTSA